MTMWTACALTRRFYLHCDDLCGNGMRDGEDLQWLMAWQCITVLHTDDSGNGGMLRACTVNICDYH